MTYSEKLKDPRWQKKRLEILSRDEFTCRWCLATKSTLHVHHLKYSGDPWEAKDEHLLTLCENCHEDDSTNRKGYEAKLLEILKLKYFRGLDIEALTDGFTAMQDFHMESVMMDTIKWALSNHKLILELKERFFESLKDPNKKIEDMPF